MEPLKASNWRARIRTLRRYQICVWSYPASPFSSVFLQRENSRRAGLAAAVFRKRMNSKVVDDGSGARSQNRTTERSARCISAWRGGKRDGQKATTIPKSTLGSRCGDGDVVLSSVSHVRAILGPAILGPARPAICSERRHHAQRPGAIRSVSRQPPRSCRPLSQNAFPDRRPPVPAKPS
jgi:hypothetical protein